MTNLFRPFEFGPDQRRQMDRDGHVAFPGLLTDAACERLVEALAHIHSLPADAERPPNHYAAELHPYLESLIGHPQLLGLARAILGDDIRYDHCVSLNRPGGNDGAGWHSHRYGEDRPDLGFVRIFFYVSGFERGDGNLKVVPGSHLFRDPEIGGPSDEALRAGWMAGKVHPETGEPLQIDELEAPPGTVIAMWTHAAHAVNPRRAGSDTRWCVVYAFRNPGCPSRARWITPAFEAKAIPGAEGLLGLY